MKSSTILDAIVVEVSRDGKESCGTGFFISNTEIVTCFHVLTDESNELLDEYWVRHYSWSDWQRVKPIKNKCFPPPKDVATFFYWRFDEDLSNESIFEEKLIFANWNYEKSCFFSRGYDQPKNTYNIGPTNIDGQIVGITSHDGISRIQLRASEGLILNGRSGSPVWSSSQNAIIGVLNFLGEGLDSKGHDLALAIPISQVITRDLEPNIKHPKTFSLHIRKKYRPLIEFSIVSEESSHWCINRLFIKYINEFDWGPVFPLAEAMMFQNNYRIVLSRQFTEYDLIPLTPNNELHHFVYKGIDSDHFSVEFCGTNVSKIRICAEMYDFTTKEQFLFESEDIQIVRSSNMCPFWDRPLGVKNGILLEKLTPISYKSITALNNEDFLNNLTKQQLKKVKTDLEVFNHYLLEENENITKDYEFLPLADWKEIYLRNLGENEEITRHQSIEKIKKAFDLEFINIDDDYEDVDKRFVDHINHVIEEVNIYLNNVEN